MSIAQLEYEIQYQEAADLLLRWRHVIASPVRTRWYELPYSSLWIHSERDARGMDIWRMSQKFIVDDSVHKRHRVQSTRSGMWPNVLVLGFGVYMDLPHALSFLRSLPPEEFRSPEEAGLPSWVAGPVAAAAAVPSPREHGKRVRGKP